LFLLVDRARRLVVGQAIMVYGFVCRRSFSQEHLLGRRLPYTFLREHAAAWLPEHFVGITGGRARAGGPHGLLLAIVPVEKAALIRLTCG
jgi:hypothetical protein